MGKGILFAVFAALVSIVAHAQPLGPVTAIVERIKFVDQGVCSNQVQCSTFVIFKENPYPGICDSKIKINPTSQGVITESLSQSLSLNNLELEGAAVVKVRIEARDNGDGTCTLQSVVSRDDS